MWPLSLNLEGGGGGGGEGDKKHYENRENDEPTNKNPRAFVSVRKIKKQPQATPARFHLMCFFLPARQPNTSTLIEIWPYQDLGLNRTYRPLTGGSIGCSSNDQRSKLPRNS